MQWPTCYFSSTDIIFIHILYGTLFMCIEIWFWFLFVAFQFTLRPMDLLLQIKDHLIHKKEIMIVFFSYSLLRYIIPLHVQMCLLVWICFSDELCGPWASCSLSFNVTYNHSFVQMWLLIGFVSQLSDVAHGSLVFFFRIYNVRPEDSGRYICYAQSSAGSARDFIMLNVLTGQLSICQVCN